MSRSNNAARQRYIQRYRATHPRHMDLIWAREREILGDMVHIGHWPSVMDQIEGWTFRRCPCGFDLAMSPTEKVYWLRKTHSAIEITDYTALLRALYRSCRFHLRPQPDPHDECRAAHRRAPHIEANCPTPKQHLPCADEVHGILSRDAP
jgi:hypothetical protein